MKVIVVTNKESKNIEDSIVVIYSGSIAQAKKHFYQTEAEGLGEPVEQVKEMLDEMYQFEEFGVEELS